MRPLYLLAERIQSLAASKELSELQFLEEALEIVCDWGFRSVRYYEVTDNPLTNSSTFILRHAIYSNPELTAELGLRVEMHHTTLASPENSIVCGNAVDMTKHKSIWINALHLRDDQWVDIALRDHLGRLSNLLAISKPKGAKPFGRDLEMFRPLQAAFQYFYLAHRLRQISKLSISLHSALAKEKMEDPLMVILRNISAILPSGSLALFEYDWSTQQVVKRAEYIRGELNAEEIPETYSPGKGLTGRAWAHQNCRLIPDFSHYCKEQDIIPHQKSLDFHEAKIGQVLTALFHRFGRGARTFMVRLLNRVDKPELPFNPTHVQVLKLACDELTEYVNEVTNKATLDRIQKLSRYGAYNAHSVRDAIEIGLEALRQGGCVDPVLFYKKNLSARMEILLGEKETKYLDNGAADFSMGVNHSVRDWSDNANREPVRDFLLANIKPERDSVLAAFKAEGCRHVIGFMAPGEQGVVIAFLGVSRSDIGSYFRPGRDIDKSALDTVLSVLSIICSVIEVSRSVMSVDDAEELMAGFGHEVITPIAIMRSVAYEGINTAISSLLDADRREALQELEEAKKEIDVQASYIKQHMDVAKAFAQQSKGALSVDFQRHPLRRLVDAAWEEALEWRQDNLDQVSYRNVQLYKNEALNNVELIVDGGLVRNIFANLFKNAIKYSFPKNEGQPIEVRVLAEPQSNMDIIHVENWGIGISSPMKEAIFSRFVREERNDRVRAIRGRGVGLFFARTYAEVHGGELFCAYSISEWADVERTAKLEGYKTCFDLRIPKYGRMIGTHTVSLNDRK